METKKLYKTLLILPLLFITFLFLGKNEVVNASSIYTSNDSAIRSSPGPTTGSWTFYSGYPSSSLAWIRGSGPAHIEVPSGMMGWTMGTYAPYGHNLQGEWVYLSIQGISFSLIFNGKIG